MFIVESPTPTVLNFTVKLVLSDDRICIHPPQPPSKPLTASIIDGS